MELPHDAGGRHQSQDYLKAWDAIGQLLAEGRSWSGRERNCCFLNTRDGRFANVAAITGLDVPQDSRGAVVADWDGDGDLDLWTTNRTRPRIQFWQNPASAKTHYVAVRLVGTRCNRDAIGARVTLRGSHGGAELSSLMRFVKAGDGHLSQSAKTLHFGLGDYHDKVDCEIRWPDGSLQSLNSLAPDQQYVITQDMQQPAVLPQRTAMAIANSGQPDVATPAPAGTSAAMSGPLRIVSHGRLPLPEISWVNAAGQQINHTSLQGKPLLLVMWASWCQPCIAELEEFSASAASWQAAGLQIGALNVEDLGTPIQQRVTTLTSWANRTSGAILFGAASELAVERLDLVQRAIVGAQETLPIPAAFLLDEQGSLLSIYKGGVSVSQILADLKAFRATTDEIAARNLRVPLPGRWFLNPIPCDLLAIPHRLREIGQAAEAEHYLQTYVGTPSAPATGVDSSWYAIFQSDLASEYFDVGMDLAKQRNFARAEAAWLTALQVRQDHREALAALSSLYGQQRRYADTLSVFQRMLRLNPRDPIVANNIAWLLATAPQADLRNPAAALQMAEALCAQTQHRVFSTLDTLAAAYAAAGRYEDAVRSAEQALKLAETQANETVQNAIRDRLEGYRNRREFVEPARN